MMFILQKMKLMYNAKKTDHEKVSDVIQWSNDRNLLADTSAKPGTQRPQTITSKPLLRKNKRKATT